MGSVLKRIRRRVQGGSRTQVLREKAAAEASIAESYAWARAVIDEHEQGRRERITVFLILCGFWAGVAIAIFRGCT